MSNRECGMIVEQPSGRPCHERRTATWRSCSVAFDATPGGRWCALTTAPARPAA